MNEQLFLEIDENNVLVESKTMRDLYVIKDSVLDKIKLLPQLLSTNEVTVEFAANYYEVPFETIKTLIKRNRSEFSEYEEIRVLSGKSLKEFCEVQDEPDKIVSPKTRSLMLINRRGLLRIGMLLTESEVAKSVRNYLLNVEEISPDENKKWAIEREIVKRERKALTDAIKDFYEGTMKKGVAYSKFTNLVYEILFDTDTNGLREMFDMEDETETPRNYMSREQLHKVCNIEKVICSLLTIGKGFREIKEDLCKNKDRFVNYKVKLN